MDLQIGDKITIKASKFDKDYLSTEKEQCLVITSLSKLGKIKLHNEIGRITILKIERPVYKIVEE